MGWTEHDTILVTGWKQETVERLHVQATALSGDGFVTALMLSTVNGSRSFAVLTSGSKSGWAAKDKWQDAAREFMKLADGQAGYADVVWLEWGGDGNAVKKHGANFSEVSQ